MQTDLTFQEITGVDTDAAIVLMPRLIEILKLYRGNDRITQAELSERMGINGAQVRALLKFARQNWRRFQFMPATDGRGCFEAVEPHEIENTIKHMIHRRDSIDATISAMRLWQEIEKRERNKQ